MKLIKSFLILSILLNTFFVHSAKKSVNKINARSDAIDSELIFLEKLYSLDSHIKSEVKLNDKKEKSGFEEFDNPITKIRTNNNNIDNSNQDTDNNVDEEEKFNVDKYPIEDFEIENNTSIDEKVENKLNQLDQNNNFLELGVKSKTLNNDSEFIKNKLDEINKFEKFLLSQEKILEEKSKELLEKTKGFLI